MMHSLRTCCRGLLRDDDGTQVVEYSLIIAVIAIGVVIGIQGLNGSAFSTFIGRVGSCLTTSSCT
jgi:pilus assembly protein Flp/PilA